MLTCLINRLAGFLLLSDLLLGLSTLPVQAQITRYVTTTGTTDPTSATTWVSSTTNLQGAIDYVATHGGGQVWVATGIYKPTSTTARDISFSMKNGVSIFGGFTVGQTDPGQRNINPMAGQPSGTTLSGDLLGNDTPNFSNNGDNSYHVILNPTGLTTTAVLDGFVISGGNANGSSPNNRGAGVYNDGSSYEVCSPTFRNCVLQGNSVSLDGGAMYNNGYYHGQSSPELTNCVLQGNSAANAGGAMLNNGAGFGQSSPVLTNCVLEGNSAKSGGAMYNFGFDNGQSSPVLTNCVLRGNLATFKGGAMYNLGATSGQSSPVLTNCVLFGNGENKTVSNDNASGPSARYSLFDNTTNINVSGPGNLTTTTNPFVSTASVVLADCSPAINAGSLLSQTAASGPYSETALPQTDLAGKVRIVGERVDMGAVEYQGMQPSVVLSLLADESACPVRLVGQGVGTSFVFTGPNGYVFSNVFRNGGTHDVVGLDVKRPGIYTLMATYTSECGSSAPVSQTVTVSRSCP